MISRATIPGLFVTGTDTGVGKTLIAGAIARHLRKREGLRVGVFKPVGSGCVLRREGLVSEDAEFLAHCAEARQPLDLICPQRYAEPLAPAVAGEREKRFVNWGIVDNALRLIARESDVVIVEGVGGILVPLDARHTMLDFAEELGLAAVVVARAGLGTINHTLLTLEALRSRGVRVAGVVVNRFPPDTPGLAEETNPRAIEKWGKAPVLAVVPEAAAKDVETEPVAGEVMDAIAAVDWAMLAGIDGI